MGLGDIDGDGYFDLVGSCKSAEPPRQGLLYGDLGKALAEAREPVWTGISGPGKFNMPELMFLISTETAISKCSPARKGVGRACSETKIH